MDKNKITLVIGSIFVFLIFLSSYIGVGGTNNNTQPTSVNKSNSSSINCNGVFAINESNAIIINYSNNLILSLNKFNQSDFNSINKNINNITNINNTSILLNNILNNLNLTNNISFSTIDNTTYDILLLNINAYDFQQLLFLKFNNYNYNAIKLLKLSSVSIIKIQPVLIFKPYSSQVSQRAIIKNKIYSITQYPLESINSIVPVQVRALINNRGVCQNSIRVGSRN